MDISVLSLNWKENHMCRKYPGPRCSGATIRFMNAAKDRLDAAIEQGAPESRIERLKAAYASHVIKYQNTPAYEKSLYKEADDLSEKAATSKSPTTKKGYENAAEAARNRGQYLRGTRIASRQAARSETLGQWKEKVNYTDDNGNVREREVKREMSVAQAASYYNAGVSGNTNARNQQGNITSAEKVRDHYASLSPKQKELVQRFEKEGFPVRDRSNWDFSNSYHEGMSPKFHEAPKSYVPRKVKVGGEKKDVTLVEGTKPMTTTVRLHDDNGLTHEAKVTISTVTDGEGNFYNVARFNGASALYGNRASQDAMDASARGSLLKTDAPHWEHNIVLSEGTVKREQVRESRRFARRYTKDVGKESGGNISRVSGELGNVISKIGTASINRRVRRNEPIMHSTLERTRNYNQKSHQA